MVTTSFIHHEYINHHLPSWTIINHHEPSLTIINHQLSWITITLPTIHHPSEQPPGAESEIPDTEWLPTERSLERSFQGPNKAEAVAIKARQGRKTTSIILGALKTQWMGWNGGCWGLLRKNREHITTICLWWGNRLRMVIFLVEGSMMVISFISSLVIVNHWRLISPTRSGILNGDGWSKEYGSLMVMKNGSS